MAFRIGFHIISLFCTPPRRNDTRVSSDANGRQQEEEARRARIYPILLYIDTIILYPPQIPVRDSRPEASSVQKT